MPPSAATAGHDLHKARISSFLAFSIHQSRRFLQTEVKRALKGPETKQSFLEGNYRRMWSLGLSTSIYIFAMKTQPKRTRIRCNFTRGMFGCSSARYYDEW